MTVLLKLGFPALLSAGFFSFPFSGLDKGVHTGTEDNTSAILLVNYKERPIINQPDN